MLPPSVGISVVRITFKRWKNGEEPRWSIQELPAPRLASAQETQLSVGQQPPRGADHGGRSYPAPAVTLTLRLPLLLLLTSSPKYNNTVHYGKRTAALMLPFKPFRNQASYAWILWQDSYTLYSHTKFRETSQEVEEKRERRENVQLSGCYSTSHFGAVSGIELPPTTDF